MTEPAMKSDDPFAWPFWEAATAGRLLSRTYPDSTTSGTFAYDAAGHQLSLSEAISSTTYDAFGRTKVITYANGVVATYGYNAARGWLDTISAVKSATTIESLTYTHDFAGRITAVAGGRSDESWTYGYDDLDRLLSAANTNTSALSQTFECELDMWLVSSGTAANALSLAAMCPPTQSILCHEEAHIERDERGAPEFFSGGAKLSLLKGRDAKIDVAALRDRLKGNRPEFVHETPARVAHLWETEFLAGYDMDPAKILGDPVTGEADPDVVVACVGGGSNAIGTFAGFLDTSARLVGIEAGGLGLESGQHGASVNRGVPGVLHGARSLFLQDEDGQIREAHSISAGLDYPGVGPEHAQLAASGRARYEYATDDEAIAGFQLLSVTEGIVPALEPAHALGWLAREAGRSVPRGTTVLVTLSGRGNKDAAQKFHFSEN